jgi:hypothetical protein
VVEVWGGERGRGRRKGGKEEEGREGEREREREREREIDFLAGFLPMVSLALDLLIRFS